MKEHLLLSKIMYIQRSLGFTERNLSLEMLANLSEFTNCNDRTFCLN